MEIFLAKPRGFCAGVNRAIYIVERALEIYKSPIYVYHEIVHNSYVVNKLRHQGVIFIERICEVPENSVLIFSAHGVSQSIRLEAKSRRNLTIFDATCPLVTKVHSEVANASRKGIEVILIGHAGHPEVEGTIGQYTNSNGGIYLIESLEDVIQLKLKNKNKLHFVTQTTLSIDDTFNIIQSLRERFPLIIGPRKDDICYATINRQEAVRKLAHNTEFILVIGSKNSSNSNRLVELVQRIGKPSKLIDSVNDIQEKWFKNFTHIGITAGASAPDILAQQIIQYLGKLGGKLVTELPGCKENIFFELPKKLQKNANKN